MDDIIDKAINSLSLDNDKINSLLVEFNLSREELKKYINDVDALRVRIGQMFPDSLDFRNRYVLDDKIKAMSSFYSVLLSLRQEINKTIKDEIELRRKLDNGSGSSNNQVDTRDLAEMVEQEVKLRLGTKPV